MPDLKAVRAFLEDRHQVLGAKLGPICESEIASIPHADSDEAARTQARVLARRMAAAGLYEPILDQDFRSCCLIREAVASTSPLADAVYALQALGTMPLILRGSDEQKSKWVKKMRTGEAISAFAMTESEAGSDVASMRTTATRDGNDYVLEGSKSFISNAGIADFYTVFASTDRSSGSKGISCFLVPKDAPGFVFVGPQILSEPHPLGEIRFDGCRISAANRIGDEGEGLKIGLATLDRLRPTVGAAACGMAARALDEATRHALERKQFGKRLADFQLTQQKLARMTMDITAARLLVYRAAWERDSGADRIAVESAMAKAFATEAAQRIVDDAVQILGGRGVLAESIVDRLYRSVRSLRIYEGTTEVQQLILASHWIKDHERGQE